jgi:uncharacterized protein
MVPANPAIGPVRGGERINTLDVVRGFALLGILLMNIPTFGFVQAAYANPNIQGGNDLLNRWVLTVIYLFGEGKMRAIFSLMFGAGTLLFISRAEERGAGIRAADLYVRRCLWLMLFGMIHAYLIWWGDILYPYGLLGLSLFVFRVMKPKHLIVIAAAMFVFMTAASVTFSWEQKKKLDAYNRIQAMDLESATLTDDQKKELDEGIKLMEDLYPSQKKIQEELDAYRGNYAANFKKRADGVWEFHALPYYFPFLWDMAAMMFLGLAFLKSGVLTGDRSHGFYKRMLAIGGVLGLAINGATMWLQWRHNFDPVRGLFDGIAYELGRVPMALSYIGGLILVVKAGKMAWLTSRLAAVGQMAFSNYISHSLICSILFYGGYGFGLIGKLERWQLYPIVLAIWVFNLTWSPIWLRHYHFGPLEWCWRSLTYWKKQPMRIRAPQPEVIVDPEPAPESAAIETQS